jgi:hypothetical protein
MAVVRFAVISDDLSFIADVQNCFAIEAGCDFVGSSTRQKFRSLPGCPDIGEVGPYL